MSDKLLCEETNIARRDAATTRDWLEEARDQAMRAKEKVKKLTRVVGGLDDALMVLGYSPTGLKGDGQKILGALTAINADLVTAMARLPESGRGE